MREYTTVYNTFHDRIDDGSSISYLSPVGTTAKLFGGQTEHLILPFDDENVPFAHG